jgi:protein phosphatase
VCGTTGTVFVTDGIVGKIYHIGDSRAYLLREGSLYLLTRDQTMAQMKADAGFYASPDMANPQEKHQLTEYIGRDRTMRCLRPAEGKWIDFREDDRLLLCTDGFFDFCSEARARQLLRQEVPLGRTVENLLEQALQNGSDDNITCALIGKTRV